MESESESKKRGRPKVLTSSAKKRKKSENDAKWNKSRVNIGYEFPRWTSLKDKLGLKTHAEMAKVLLDSYESKPKSPTTARDGPVAAVRTAITSTPAARKLTLDQMSDISEISSIASHDCGSDVSGMKNINYSDDELAEQPGRKQRKYDSGSFVNPFEMTIEVSDDESENGDSSDVDYEPSINITVGPANRDGLQEVTFEEVEFGQEEEEEEEDAEAAEAEDSIEPIPGIQRLLAIDDQHQLTDDECHIVYQQPLLNLARLRIDNSCNFYGCDQYVDLQHESIGSAIYIKWVCRAGHFVYKWCSQPVMNRRLHGGDLLLSAAVMLSGNNFTKVALFAKFMKLHFVSSTVFLRIQRTYLVPSIDSFWQERQTELLTSLQDEQLVLLGDGRMDSPGHSAQYCSYTMMHNDSKRIVSLITLDKRQTQGKSSNLEKLGFQKSMEELAQKGCSVTEVVTDAHMQISSIMKKDFPHIKHSHDIWHAAKNIGKKIIKAGQEKQCKDLLPWAQHVTNHFWHASKTANTYEEFLGVWFGTVHHVIDEHQWVFAYGSGQNVCSHGPLTGERSADWLKKGSPAHKALIKIVMDKRLMNNIKYYLNFRHTGELENFQNHILMYAAKRFAYTPPVYRARNLLAALDYNEHVGRPCHLNADGSRRYKRLYNKKSGRWTVVEMKTPKTYHHIADLINKIVSNRLIDRIGMQGPATLEADDPRRLSKTIARTPAPPTKDLVSQKKSRLKEQEASV